MDIFSKAKKVLRILEKHGFEAYIVGGAVRDYLLKQKSNDIDITTSAKPTEVMRIFKTKPTGLKYGSVTILFDELTYEVTTFRQDGPTKDFRHPDSVIYSESVLDDVKRRDFTMNALIMDASGKIHDHVHGKDDLRMGLIKAIGEPELRFNEDALRILRAIYFQSKFGFEIDNETKKAMSKTAHLIKELASERILQELIKILKEKHIKKALQTMIELGIDEQLPGLSKGIKYCANLDKMPYIDPFFTLCFILNDGVIPDAWKFSNKDHNKYLKAAQLATQSPYIDQVALYQYGLEISLLANKTNSFLNKTAYAQNKIIAMYEELPVKSELDLAISSDEMMTLLNKKPGAWISQAKTSMVQAVLTGTIKNNKEELNSFLARKYQGGNHENS